MNLVNLTSRVNKAKAAFNMDSPAIAEMDALLKSYRNTYSRRAQGYTGKSQDRLAAEACMEWYFGAQSAVDNGYLYTEAFLVISAIILNELLRRPNDIVAAIQNRARLLGTTIEDINRTVDNYDYMDKLRKTQRRQHRPSSGCGGRDWYPESHC